MSYLKVTMLGFGLAKWLIIAGGVLVAGGALLWIGGKMGLPLGSLPGDIHIKREGGSFHFPLVTCILVSAALTLIINLVLRLFR